MTKLVLKFNHSDSVNYPCACLVYREGETVAWIASTCKTWAEAETEAIAKAKAQLDAGPPPETKEISI